MITDFSDFLTSLVQDFMEWLHDITGHGIDRVLLKYPDFNIMVNQCIFSYTTLSWELSHLSAASYYPLPSSSRLIAVGWCCLFLDVRLKINLMLSVHILILY